MADTLTREEALAQAWASIDGKLERFLANKADRSLDDADGSYPGYMEEAREMIERLEKRGYTVAPTFENPRFAVAATLFKNKDEGGISYSLHLNVIEAPDQQTARANFGLRCKDDEPDYWLADVLAVEVKEW